MDITTPTKTSAMRSWIATPFSNAPLFLGFVRQDIKGRFAGSAVGLLWAFLVPLSNILIYIFVFSIILKIKLPASNAGSPSFVVYLLSGLLPWMAFSECLIRSTDILLANSSIISKVAFPVQVLPYSLVSVSFIFNGIGFIIFLCYLALGGDWHSSWLLLPILVVCLYLFVLGLVAILSSLTVFLRDLREIVSVLVQIWFYATPILYPLAMVPERFRLLMDVNPVLPFITAFRQCLLQGRFWSGQFTIAVLLALCSYVLGGYCFMRLKPAFGDVI